MSEFGPENKPGVPGIGAPIDRTPDRGVYSIEEQGGRAMRFIQRPFSDLALAYYPDGVIPTTTDEAEQYLAVCTEEYRALQGFGVKVLMPEYDITVGASDIIVVTKVEALEWAKSLSRLTREDRAIVAARAALGQSVEGFARYLEARVGDGQSRTVDPFLYDVYGLKQLLAIGLDSGQTQVALADVEPRIVAPNSPLRPNFMLQALAHLQDMVVFGGMFSAGKHIVRQIDGTVESGAQLDFEVWRDKLAYRIISAEGITDPSRLEVFREFVGPSFNNLEQLPKETFESMRDVLIPPR